MSIDARKHIVELQSLRGLAAALVMISHASTVYAIPKEARVGIDAVLNAHSSVVLFFVLSGFVLQASLAKSRPTIKWAADFYIRRIFRIYPAIWVVSGLSILSLISFQTSVPGSSDWFAGYFAADRFTIETTALSFVGFRNYLIPPVWTVLVELVGSAFMPLFALLAFQERRLWLVIALLLVPSYLLLDMDLFRAQILGYIFDFALGAAVWSSRERIRRSAGPDLLLKMLGLGAGLLLCRAAYSLATRGYLVALDIDYQVPIIGLIEAFFSAGLVAVIVTGPNGAPWLRSPILVWLGDISFSVYLIHFPLMSGLAWLLYRHFGVGTVPTFGGETLLVMLTALITLPLASLCYRYIERPGISTGRGFLELIRRGSAGSIRTTPAQ